MGRILVTGASGDIGRKTLRHLLKRRPAADLVGLVRDPLKAQDLTALGIELRQGDYMDPGSLPAAFAGVEKVILTSTHAFTDRDTAHGNAVDAAVAAGVRHLVFMSIIRQKGTRFTMKEITGGDLFAEQKIIASGLDYTLVRHPPFLDVLSFYIGAHAHENGIRVLAGHGKFAVATRDDLAEAHAAILAGEGHEGKEYALTGDPAVSFSDIADILSSIHGRDVPFEAISAEKYADQLRLASGAPEPVIDFVLEWVRGMNAGEWQDQTTDLQTLIGRKAKTPFEFFRDQYLRTKEA